MQLFDVFSGALLAEMVGGGYVRRQTHPSLPLSIYNYSEKTAYERVWNECTTECRGLIVDDMTGRILARPLPKFMNYGEDGAAVIAMDEPVEVTDKLDGVVGRVLPRR